MAHSKEKAEALAFLKSKKSGVLSTVTADQQPRGRLVYFTTDDAFNIYFITLANTRKANDLDANSNAAFTVADEAAMQTLQLEGTVADVTDSPTDNLVIETLFDHLALERGEFPPLARLDRSDIRFFKLMPSWVRWGSFHEGFHTKDVLFELTP